MGTDYKAAPEIAEIAKQLIADHHSHLVEANIEFLWREGAWTSKGKLVLGAAVLASGREKFYLDGADFVILINASAWIDLDPPQRRAAVDHQLYHCEKDGDGERNGAPKWMIAPHDVEEFTGVVDRHGMYINDIRQFAETVARKTDQLQLRLTDLPEDGILVADAAVKLAAAEQVPGAPPESWEYTKPDTGVLAASTPAQADLDPEHLQ